LGTDTAKKGGEKKKKKKKKGEKKQKKKKKKKKKKKGKKDICTYNTHKKGRGPVLPDLKTSRLGERRKTRGLSGHRVYHGMG